MARKGQFKSRGMTLVEVIVALVLLSFGLIGVTQMQLGAFQSMKANRDSTQADYLAQDLLASLQTAGFAALDDKVRTLAKAPDLSQAALFGNNRKLENPFFSWNANLRKTSFQEGVFKGTGYVEVTVSVYWTTQGHEMQRKAVGYVFAM